MKKFCWIKIWAWSLFLENILKFYFIFKLCPFWKYGVSCKKNEQMRLSKDWVKDPVLSSQVLNIGIEY